MQCALKLAQRAWDEGEVPVGAVLTCNNKLISRGWNQSIKCYDPTAHAEIVALRQGGLILNNYRLTKCTLYVTLEPCLMCYGAIIHGRITNLVYGAKKNEKVINNKDYEISLFKHLKLNHKIKIIGGVFELACSKLLTNFFHIRRSQKFLNKKINNLNR